MAEAVVCFVAEGLEDFVSQKGGFLSEICDQVKLSLTELQLMRGLAKVADARQGDGEIARLRVAKIREAAYDLEVVIETFALKVACRRKGVKKNVMKRYACIFIDRIRVRKIESEIGDITNNISAQISELRLILQMSRVELVIPTYVTPTRPFSVTETHVGLEDSVEELVMHLVENENIPVISIWGMGGSGKTTLAKKVYNHNKVRSHFDCLAWVCLSEQFEARRVWEEILVQFISSTNDQRDEIADMWDHEIAQKLYLLQQEKRCLVVVDDIWSIDSWRHLEVAFPSEKTWSKILFTTRNKAVAVCAHRNGFLYECGPLKTNESWKLFESIALSGRNDIDSEVFGKMKELGEKMIQHCAGLPLAIVALAGLLARKATLIEWNAVYNNVSENISRTYNYISAPQILAISYDDLPYHLKPCFLYLGQFPEDFEIPVKGLTQLWMAEGFISLTQQKQRLLETLEDVAYNCLSELVERCMVQVGNTGSVRKIKTCRMHDLMRELCLLKAEEENFLRIVNFSNIAHKPTGKVRRLALYFNENDVELVSSRYESHDHVRSLLFFGPKNWTPISTKFIKSTFKDLKFLRVLKVEDMVGEVRLPTEIGNMLCLRFLSLRKSKIIWLPPSLGNLICLQTLNLDFFYDRTPIIPNVIWKMEQLRHLYLPYCSSSGILRLSNLCNLQTLSCVSSHFFDMSDLTELINLRKLGIRLSRPMQNLKELLESASSTLNRIRSLFVMNDVGVNIHEEVTQIVLSCRRIYKLKLYGPIKELSTDPQHYPNLTKLSLCECHLKDDQMAILEKLPNLRILLLQSLSFQESTKTLVCSRGGFLRLETLSLKFLTTIKEWRIEEGTMPRLRQLGIHSCYGLKTVPHGLVYITSLKYLTIHGMPRTFNSRLQEGGEDFYIVRHVPSRVFGDL